MNWQIVLIFTNRILVLCTKYEYQKNRGVRYVYRAKRSKKMEELMRAHIVKLKKPQTSPPPLEKPKRHVCCAKCKQGKNAPKIPMHELSWQWNDEVDIMSIKGVGTSTVLTINSEIGQSFDNFPTAKAFTKWLRLLVLCTKYAVSPDNRISGGKVLSSRVRKGSNRVASALRHAAESIGKIKDAPLLVLCTKYEYIRFFNEFCNARDDVLQLLQLQENLR